MQVNEFATVEPGWVQRATVGRIGVLVLGMHRSGTSALAGVLGKLGCKVPNDLLGAGVGNEKGHWEPEGIVELNDRILASAGSHWDDWCKVNPDWYASPVHPTFLDEAIRCLRQSFGVADLFVLKDPRICRLLPIWLAAMDAEVIKPAVVLCLRNPAEVAASLAERDGMKHRYAQLLWLRHMLEAEIGTRGRKRAICSFEQLRRNWSETTEAVGSALGISWPRKSAAVYSEVNDFIFPDAPSTNFAAVTPIPDWVGQAHDIFERWLIHGEDELDYAKLDEVRNQLDRAENVFGGLLVAVEHSLGAGGGIALRQLHAETMERLELLEKSLHLREAENEQAQVELAHLRELASELEAVRASGAEAIVRLEVAEGALHQREVELELGRVELEQSARRIEAAESELQLREAEIADTRCELDRMQTMTTALAQQLAARKEELDRVTRQFRSEHAELVERLKDANLKVKDAEDRMGQQFRESAAMTRMLLNAETERDYYAEMLEWLASTSSVVSTVPIWWRLLPKRWRSRKVQDRLMRRGLFNANIYLELNPDVAAAKVDPLRHYIQHGMKEGRRASA